MADDVRGTDVTFASNGATAPGYLATPAQGAGPWPGVVVIQEWWGLDEHIRDVARRFARAGFVALAPDLYHGQLATEPDEARKLVMALQMDVALRDIRGAAAYLRGLEQIAPKKIGVVGFCMGGRLAQVMAVQGGAEAAVAFYGGTDLQPAQVVLPLLAIYGEDDQGSPPERITALRAAFADTASEVVSYAGAPHAFFNDARPSYRPPAAQDAWQRTVDWLRQHLAA
jgi:carboxymethylenebutenolidase